MFDSNIPAKLMAVIAILMLQGCGHKGPLVLPVSKVPAPQAAASQVPATSQPVPDAQNPGTPAAQPNKQP